MKVIRGFYPMYYRNDDTIQEAVALWAKILENEDFNYIQKGLYKFVKTDSKGFPPVPGQIITLSSEIRREEWWKRKREQDLLPEPKTERAEMPAEIREKLKNLFTWE